MQEIPSAPPEMSSGDLMKELFSDVTLLVKRQVTLARIEAEKDLGRGKSMVSLLGAAGIVGFMGLIILLMAAALAIGMALSGLLWAGALIIAGGLFLIAALLATAGWAGRVRTPIGRSRDQLEKEISWVKRQPVTT